MAKKAWSNIDFSGGLQKVTTDLNVKPTELSVVKNADLASSLGGIRNRKGYTKYASTVTNAPEITGLYDYEQNNGTHNYLLTANGTADVVDQQQTGYSQFVGPPNTIYGTYWSGQTFQAGGNYSYVSVTLYIRRVGSPGDLLVELRNTSAGKPSTTVHAVSQVSSSSIPINATYHTFVFSTAYTVTSGTTYAIVLRQYGAGGDAWDNCYVVYGNTSNAYANGIYYTTPDSGSNWTAGGLVLDLYFKTIYSTVGAYSDLHKDVSGTWTAQSESLTVDAKGEFETFINRCFIVNYSDNTRSYNGTTWVDSGDATAYANYVLDAPKGKYVKEYANRLWIANNSAGRSTLYYSSEIQGYVGSPIASIDGTQSSATTTTVTVDTTKYLKDGLKFDVYDPDGTKRTSGDSKEVLTVASPTTFTIASTDLSSVNWEDYDELYLEDQRGTEYILWDSARSTNNKAYGTDWLPISSDDGEEITWLEVGFDRLIVFKDSSIRTVDPELNTSKAADVGTPCGRSVVSIQDAIYFFSPTGVYKFSGEGTEKISHKLDKYINAISPAGYSSMCAGKNGMKYCLFVGNIASYNLTNVMFEYDTSYDNWTMHILDDTPTVFATVESAGASQLWFGDTDGMVQRYDYGATDNTAPINMEVETGWYHLEAPEVVKRLTDVYVFTNKESPGIKVSVMSDMSDGWVELGETVSEYTTLLTGDILGRLFKLRFEYIGSINIEIQGITLVYGETEAR